MKTILLPTDFSEASRFASQYIINLHRGQSVNYHLIHSYDPASTAGSLISIEDIIRKDAEKSLREEISWMKSIGVNEDHISSEIFFGEFSDVVNRQAKRTKADIIVLGTTGASGLKEIIGSNASTLIKRSNIPVLGIPFNSQNNKGRILFPVNLSEQNDFSSIELLKEFAQLNNAQIEVYYGSDAAKDDYIQIEKEKENLISIFGKDNLLFTIESCDDVTHRIIELIDTGQYSMLAMLPHKYGILKSLFTQSVTKKVAMKTSIPLLGIH